MNVVVDDGPNVESVDRRFEPSRDNIRVIRQKMEPWLVLTQEEGCDGAEDGECVGVSPMVGATPRSSEDRQFDTAQEAGSHVALNQSLPGPRQIISGKQFFSFQGREGEYFLGCSAMKPGWGVDIE